ncbi:MAG: hypothetical protein LM587_02150 [Candidatus Aenigmarchaeota archaeon]|nr:hypothetical protein [Candidatus Aenigmarchaeota archaeon]
MIKFEVEITMSKELIEIYEKGGKVCIVSDLKKLVEYVKKSTSLFLKKEEILRFAVYYFYLLGSLNCEREERAFRLYVEEELPLDSYVIYVYCRGDKKLPEDAVEYARRRNIKLIKLGD